LVCTELWQTLIQSFFCSNTTILFNLTFLQYEFTNLQWTLLSIGYLFTNM
jgi:hypothetical protein